MNTRRKRLIRSLILSLPLICAAVMPRAHEAQGPRSDLAFEKQIQPFLTRYCYSCHNSTLNTAGLNLEGYKTAASVSGNRERWQRVLQRLNEGEMPPEGAPRPNEAELRPIITWIEEELEGTNRAAKPDPGRVTIRRLNRAEYNNTVRDLLGVSLRPADDFPQDDSGYGFDNIGDVLSLSPVLMEKYLSAAERVARAAVYGSEPMKPSLIRLRASRRKIVHRKTPLFDYDLTGLTVPNAFHAMHRFPVAGEFLFRIFLDGVRPAGSEPVHVVFWIDGRQVRMMESDPEAAATFSQDIQEFYGRTLELRAKVEAGEHWLAASILRMYEGLPPRFEGPSPSKRPTPPAPEFKPPPYVPAARLEALRKAFDEHKKELENIAVNDIRIGSLEIGGPYDQAKGPSIESLKRIYSCGHLKGGHQPGCERRIVAQLARRAYRRPVSRAEVNKLLSLFSMARRNGDSFEEGIAVALQAMLISPHFLFRIERDLPGEPHPVSPHELASRLSYFLWSSMPDEELSRAADRGILREPRVLAAQVRRMLKDARSRALVENFGGQWLELRKLESARPDLERFPDFDPYLRMSMLKETELFFESIVRDDGNILDFIDGNYTILNERLARFYGVPGVKGSEFRRVPLNGKVHRGGVLTHASVLTVSSYSNRTSPVLRGKWILENFLAAPPPPPPPDVPNLDEGKVGTAASLRLQLEQHSKNPTCASCHARIDPLGFGLENFDAIGAWRTQSDGVPIDASGTLPDGRSFRGPQELKTILKADCDAFTECLTEKLLTYALGRGLDSNDQPTVRKIAAGVAAGGYRFSSLVMAIVKSAPFQMRKGGQTQ